MLSYYLYIYIFYLHLYCARILEDKDLGKVRKGYAFHLRVAA